MSPTEQTNDTSLTPTIQMNAISDSTVTTMQQQILQLQQMIAQMQPNQQNGQFQQQQGYQGYIGGRGGRRGGRGGRAHGRGLGYRGRFSNQNTFGQQNQQNNPFVQNQQNNPLSRNQQQQEYPRTFTRYCWSHGMCGHTSNICNRPAPGHCYDATIDNKMSGNTANCPT